MNLAEFHFIRPYWLLAFMPYVVVLASLLRSKLNQGVWASVCDAALLPYLLQDKAVAQSRWPLATGAVAALLAIIALAGPTWERLPTPVFRNDSALVIILDLSQSMDATDIKPSRLVMARYKIADILKQRKDGQTALLVYAGDAYTVTPLTNDTETINSQLSALTTQIMPSDGNNAARALEKAEELFKQAGMQKGQILLISDGGKLIGALSKAKSLGAYQLLVLGVGTPDGAPIALETGGFLKDEQGGIIVDKLDVNGLEKLAQAGNGTYQTLTADDADIQALLSALATQPQEQGEKNENLLLDQWIDKGPWLLLLVLPLAALSFRKGLLGLAFLIILPLPENSYALDTDKAWQDLWKTKDQQAQEAYNNKQYDNAADLFEDPNWKAAAHYKSGAFDKALENLKNNTNANSFYNQGNAFAQSGQLQQALDAYNKALKLNADDGDTLFNKGLVEKELERQKQEQGQDQNQQNKDNKQDAKENKNQGQKGSDNKPGQKSEQSQESLEDQPEQKESAKSQEQESKPEAEKPQQNKRPDAQNQDSANPQALGQMTDEEKKASEQWLKRIPDDPAGLLRRKFKYQYDQRGRQ
jgi:Ca-activated chloride channel homolog